MKVHHFHKSVGVCKKKYVKLCTYEIQYRYFCPVWGSAKKKKKKKKNLRKRYVYWGLQPSKAQFPSGNAIFASGAATRPHQNQNSKNPFLQKTLFPPGIGGVERKPEKKKIPMIGSHFWPFLAPDWGGKTFWAKIPTPRWAPLSKFWGCGPLKTL